MGPTTSVTPGPAVYLPVGQCVPSGGRTSGRPRAAGMVSTLPPAASIARRGRLREPVGTDRQRLGELAPAEHLDQPALRDQAVRPQRSGRDLGARVEPSRVVEVHDEVLDPEGVLEPFGLRCAAVQRRLTALEPRGDGAARALALGPRPAVLPPLPPMPRPTRRFARREPGAGFRSWTFIVISSTATRCGTRATMPRISGRSGNDGCGSDRAADRARARCRAASVWCRCVERPA